MTDSTNPRVMADNIKILDKKIKAADVNANPEGEATGTLTKLGVDGSIYSIPQGTSVTANPEGEATETLTKLEVGTGIYSIPVYTPVDYSENEVNTGIKWIDGKTIYRKVITGNLTRGSWTTLTHGVSGNIISVSGFVSGNNLIYGIQYYESASLYIATQVSATSVDCKVNFSSGDYTGTFIIEYTKTSET